MKRLAAAALFPIGSIVIHFVLLAMWKDAVTGLWEQPRYLLSMLVMTVAGAWIFNPTGWGWLVAFLVSFAVQLLADVLLTGFLMWLLQDLR